MKKKIYITFAVIIGLLVIFLVGKQVIKQVNPSKPTVDLTVYTISSSDTKNWNKVKQVETTDGIYLITVKEVASSEEIFSNIIEDTATMGFGIDEKEVKQFNDNLKNPVIDAKNNKLIGLEFLNFSNANEGFVIADFDYGQQEFNAQKKGKTELYKTLYEAYKEMKE